MTCGDDAECTAKTMPVVGDDRHEDHPIERYTCGRPEDLAT